MRDGGPAAGKSLCPKGGVETHRGGLYGVTTLSGVNAEDNLRVPPEEPGWP